MSIKIYRKNTAGRRNMSVVKPQGLTDKKPEKRLLLTIQKFSGRSLGKISVRHKGGGNKRRYRMIDFLQKKLGVPGKVIALEKDPYRSALIALVQYADGDKRYVVATSGMKEGSTIVSQENASIQEGNRLKLKNIPSGHTVCLIEMTLGKGAQIVRSAGSSAAVMGQDGSRTQIRLSSGEIRLVNAECYATLGQVSNFEHNSARIGKAGKSRWKGKRPAVRGSAMNPVDHPHGGGEGRQGIGLKYPKTPWGKPALGKKTRRKKKSSSVFILKRRSKKR